MAAWDIQRYEASILERCEKFSASEVRARGIDSDNDLEMEGREAYDHFCKDAWERRKEAKRRMLTRLQMDRMLAVVEGR